MKRRRARPPRPAPSAAARRTGPARWRLWLWAVPLALAAVLWLALHRPPARPHAPADDALASSDLLALYRTAVGLGRAGRHAASLPYFRRIVEISRGDSWQLHFNYGSALYNTTIQVGARDGLPVAAMRSSFERVQLAREAERQFDTAESMARTRGDLAFVVSSRARMTWLWGLPWETLRSYRRAQAVDPARADLADMARRYADLMRSPTTSTLREADPAPAAAK